ncbi:hypothetical protein METBISCDRAFT_20330, partial [Metschnikowia bicuspidata]
SFVTTDPAPHTAPSPMVTPGITVTPLLNHTVFPTVIGFAYSTDCNRKVGSTGCVTVMKLQLGPIITLSPKVMSAQSKKVALKFA